METLEKLYSTVKWIRQESTKLGIYDDARSDDKSVEPESVVVTKMGDKTILFVGLEKLMRLWCMMFRILLLQNF
jgi:hypothetical protein